MRIRALKPGFFLNEQLADLSPWHRLCFAGLWCCADREGRIRDRPKRLKAEIFPYDDLDMNHLLWDLARVGFIVRYETGGHPYITIPTWHDHQHPRQDEAPSEIPAFDPGMERKGGPDLTTFPAVRPIVTDPSLSSYDAAAVQRMGNGDLDLGNGKGRGADAPAFRAQDLLDLWNATTKPPLPRCRELTDDRRQKIRVRLKKRPSIVEWREAFEYVNSQPFYRGENDRGWVADFDWMTKNDTVVAKVLERAKTAGPPVRKAVGLEHQPFECPHEPVCSGRNACHIRQQIDAEKARAS